MIAKFDYKIIPDLHLIVDRLSGDIYFDNYMEYKSKQVQDPNFDPTFDVLLDLRDSNLKFTTEEIDRGAKMLLRNKDFVGQRKIAQLTNTPNQVVVSTLVNIKQSPFQSFVFSTIDKAIWYLGHENGEQNEIEKALHSLKRA